jgi:hypothetical protein
MYYMSPLKNNQNLIKSNTKISKTPIKVLDNNNLNEKNINLEITQNPTPIIKKKKEYKTFIKLVRQGKYVSARVTAQALGVDPATIVAWNRTPLVQKALSEAIDYHISTMQQVGNKDWKMHDKIIDRLVGTVEGNEAKQQLNQLIVINT